MSDLHKKAMAKAQTNSQAKQKPKAQQLYSMRCVQCSDGHRLCSREVPCKTCVGAKRGADCRYPPKAKLVTVEPEDSEEEEEEEEEEVDDDDDDMTTFQRANKRGRHGNDRYMNDPEDLEAEQAVPMGSAPGPSQSQPIPPSNVPRHTAAWTVAMHFTRAQILHQAEAMAADPTIGFINPRIRPDLDPSHPSYIPTVEPPLVTPENDPMRGFGPFPEYEHMARNSDDDLTDGRDFNEVGAGELLDDMLNHQSDSSTDSEMGDEDAGPAQLFDFSGPEFDGVNTDYEGFTDNGRFTLANSSLQHLCVETRATGLECCNPCTFSCEQDHSYMNHNPHHVCHDCRVNPDLYESEGEGALIEAQRIYFCADCTTRRATGPALQMWTHPRRFAELKTRKVNKCSCHQGLEKGWICQFHRSMKAEWISTFGPEKVRSFRTFFGGDFCADCRTKAPESDGPVVMWQCAVCDDFVLQE